MRLKNCLKSPRFIIFTINTIFYIVMAILGIIGLFTSKIFSAPQAKLIITEVFQSLAYLYVIIIVQYVFKIKIPIVVDICASLFIFFSVFLGESFALYYKIPFWDILLHTASGVLLFLLSYYLISLAWKTDRKRFVGKMIYALSLTMFIGIMWEVAEFFVDSIMGTNMQHYMPENSDIFNGGNSRKDLLGTDKEIADYYRSPKGYRFGIMDTMEDILCNLAGGLAAFFGSSMYIIYKNKKIDKELLENSSENIENTNQVVTIENQNEIVEIKEENIEINEESIKEEQLSSDNNETSIKTQKSTKRKTKKN